MSRYPQIFPAGAALSRATVLSRRVARIRRDPPLSGFYHDGFLLAVPVRLRTHQLLIDALVFKAR
ncbi:hypothetical protein JTL55_35555, partial [Pseudomonas aeruginosa]|nr:hypothetical protein [Pseudomonas aeruginosa]